MLQAGGHTGEPISGHLTSVILINPTHHEGGRIAGFGRDDAEPVVAFPGFLVVDRLEDWVAEVGKLTDECVLREAEER